MPIFKTTKNALTVPWEDELFNPNWMDSNSLITPEHKKWDYKRELKIEDVQVWEQIYLTSGGTGLFAAWDPYAEFYLVIKDAYWSKNPYIETFYGKNAAEKAYKKAIELGIPVQKTKIWVDDEDMWLYS
jgi:hypothetical protein